jgi:glucose-1-phosphate thymidylyltransferase
MYHADVFEVTKRLEPSARNEFEITDVNNVYAAEGTLTYNILEGWWSDVGTHETLQEAGNRYLQNDL